MAITKLYDGIRGWAGYHLENILGYKCCFSESRWILKPKEIESVENQTFIMKVIFSIKSGLSLHSFSFPFPGHSLFFILFTSSLVFSLLVMWKNIIAPPRTPLRMVNDPYKTGSCWYSAMVPQTKLANTRGRMMSRVLWLICAVVLAIWTQRFKPINLGWVTIAERQIHTCRIFKFWKYEK